MRIIGIRAFMQNVEYTVRLGKPRYMLRLLYNFGLNVLGRCKLRGVDIAISYDCNLGCEHCNVELLKDKTRAVLSADEICGIIKSARGEGLVNITFTGGEVLLSQNYAKLKDILRQIDTGLYLIHIQTNATLLTDEKIEEMKSLGVDKLILSFDPYHETDDWEEMFSSRIALVKSIKSHGLKTIGVAVAARNVIYTEPFLRMIDLARELDIWLVLNLPIPLGRWLNNEEVLLTREDQQYLRDLVDRNYHVRLDFDLNFLRYGCPAFTERFHVNAYGDVQPCTFSQISFGNLREESIAEIRSRGLMNKTYNTFKRYCPPAEDRRFIYKYWEEMNKTGQYPLRLSSMFDESGNIKPSQRQLLPEERDLSPLTETGEEGK